MSADQLETELINKITELQQEAKEHQLVLDAFKTVEPTRKCFRMIGGVLVERTVADIKPSLEENLVNIDKAIGNLSENITKRREQRAVEGGSSKSTPAPSGPAGGQKVASGSTGVLA